MARIPKDPGQEQNPGSGSEKKGLFTQTGVLYEKAPAPEFGYKLGSTFRVAERIGYTAIAGNSSVIRENVNLVTPGVCSVGFAITYGVAKESTDAINMGALDSFKAVQDALKQRNLSYDRVAVFFHLVCLEGLHLVYEDLNSAMAFLNTSDDMNKYISKAVITAKGFNYDDLIDNKPTIQSYLEKYRKILLDYPLPKVFNTIEDHLQMVTHIFRDEERAKTQMYVPRLTYVPSYERVDTENRIVAMEWHPSFYNNSSAAMTWAQAREKMDLLFNSITNSTDADKINAALVSTFGETRGMHTPSEVFTNTAAGVATYSQNFLDALVNATVLGSTFPLEPNSLYPVQIGASNIVHVQPKSHTFIQDDINPVVNMLSLNTSKERISSTDFVNSMRFRVALDIITPDPDNATNKQYIFTAMGPELITDLQIVEVDGSIYKANGLSVGDVISIDPIVEFTESGREAISIIIAKLANFRYHPAYIIKGANTYAVCTDMVYSGAHSVDDLIAADEAIWWKNFTGN